MIDYSKEFEAIARAYEASGGDAASLLDKKSASLVVSHNKILGKNEIPGVHIDGGETPTGAQAKITVDPGTIVKQPVHLCFGVIPKEGLQEIVSEFNIGDDSKVTFLAHCSFPNAVKVKHTMDAKIYVGKRAEGDLKKDAVCEFDAKVYGKKEDKIVVKESIFLNGENARGLAKSRIVASDRCESEVIGEAIGNAPFARGHIDCVEIIKGKGARASAIPRLVVIDDRAKLTHEAAIGSVDKKQVETLMARGLAEDEAVDVVVKGMLR
jgi:Fe-S cluster assembly scaffold protein SufB